MEIWAHRGASARQPENTIAAFVAAMEAGADGVELDVQLSADGVPVVIHDEKVERTHAGTGWVASHTVEQLQALPSVLKPKADPLTTRIPTLAEVLDLLAAGNQRINIELKNSVKPYKGLEAKVLAMIAERKLGKRAVLSSFNHYSLQRLRERGWTGELAAIHDGMLREAWRYFRELDVQAVHPSRHVLMVPGYVTRAHRAGFRIRVWTVNKAAQRQRCVRLGVDGIFTDVMKPSPSW
ncbi:glycerophosphodiester phosphodiesterase family protein [Micropruina sonneratiae]|uniref:glycerophosphodiester phosphodiesterase family protein n=1 Tax=Micropruina sonneratiae TaxID=2986940 RepID=UPI002226F27E|nr:glycerophosphodiester phosphodiesterase family protein [Micropruina sp. KQZ13P-5]MCW3159108.1 glycerophosphodiester phosphodiesterase family protein [Micropruina sp. KQZ13P-5]